MSSDLCASCPHPNSPVVPDGSDGCSRCRTCILRDCTSTISKTSRDGSVSLVDDDLPVVNFDSVKECYCKKVNRWMQLPRSADALYCDRETLYLVEFKNGSLKETLGKRLNPKDDEELGINLGQRDALIEKCKDSVLICSDLWGKRTRWFREHCVFVLVYNEDKNKTALKRVASSIRKKARFGLPDKLKGFCVKDVLTLTESFRHRSFQLGETQKKSRRSTRRRPKSIRWLFAPDIDRSSAVGFLSAAPASLR